MLTGYTLVFIKLALGILALILQMNLMGKGNLAPNSALDQVQNYVLGGIIGAVIYSESIGILQFFLVLIAWTIVVMGLRFLSAHVRWIGLRHLLMDDLALSLIGGRFVSVNV